MTEDEARKMLIAKVGYTTTQATLAKRVGCSPTLMCMMLSGERRLNESALAYLGLRRVTKLEPIGENNGGN